MKRSMLYNWFYVVTVALQDNAVYCPFVLSDGAFFRSTLLVTVDLCQLRHNQKFIEVILDELAVQHERPTTSTVSV